MEPSRPVCLVAFALTMAGPLRSPTAQPAQTPAPALIAEKAPACDAIDEEDVADVDRGLVGWRCRDGQKWVVLLNGARQGGVFEEVRSLVLSPDGRLAFAGRRGGRWMVVSGGSDSTAAYDDVGSPTFSKKGERLAYPAKRDKRWLMVDQGNEGTTSYEDIGSPRFSPDGTRIAFRAKPGKKWVLVVDGAIRGPEFDQVVAREFSPDGTRVAYVGSRGTKYMVVADDVEGPPFDIVGGLEFSVDGRRFGYAGAAIKRGFGKQKAVGRAVIDGKAGPEHEGMQIGSFMKSAMGDQVELIAGYIPQFNSEVHGVSSPTFSADAGRAAYAARLTDDATVVVVDGEAGPPGPSLIAGPRFIADGRRVAVVALKDKRPWLLVDGAEVGAAGVPDTDYVSDLVVDDRSGRVAFVGVVGGDRHDRGMTRRARRSVYVDGTAGREYNALFLGRLRFTPDGRRIVYVVGGVSEASRDVAFLVVDSTEGPRYDDILGVPAVEPDGGAIAYIGQTGRRFYKVRHALGSTSAH